MALTDDGEHWELGTIGSCGELAASGRSLDTGSSQMAVLQSYGGLSAHGTYLPRVAQT